MSRKRPLRRVVPPNELAPQALADSIREGTDLACALVCGAYIENSTGSLLEMSMIIVKGNKNEDNTPNRLLNDPSGILSSAGARADMCYCFGLIDKTTHTNTKAIAYIRNQFAHSHIPINFNNKAIKNECERLTVFLGDMSSDPPGPLDESKAEKLLSVPRRRFVLATCWTFLSIHREIVTSITLDKQGDICFQTRTHPSYPKRGQLFLSINERDGKESILGTDVFLDE